MRKFLALIGVLAFLLPGSVLAARTDALWDFNAGGNDIYPNANFNGVNILIKGVSKYLNFNSVVGTSGYGIRDNAGVMEFKNSGGAWAGIGTGGSGGTGTVTSVDVSGGTTGLTTSGGPVTTNGTITIAGILNIANGGTGSALGPFSTTSTDYWLTTKSLGGFSTTSANFWASVGLAFSTTSDSYFLSQNQGAAYSTTSENYYQQASTTIPKTYTANTFGLTQTFTLAPIFSSLTGVLKGNGASAVTVAANGTDFTLITANTCGAGNFFSAITAAGVLTCGLPSSFSTTSASYFASLGLAFSTTSSDYWGSTKGYLTGNQTITLSGDVTGSGATSISTLLAMTVAHWWTALQNFGNASTSQLTATSSVWFTSLGVPAGTILAVDPTGKVIATTTSAGGVTAVTGTYPVQSTGGATPAISLAFGTTTANSWSSLQTLTGGFIAGASSTISSGLFTMSGGASTTNFTVSGSSYLGTVKSGTWNGGVVSTQYGGTGLSNPGSVSSDSFLVFNGSSGAVAFGVGANDTIIKSNGGTSFTMGSLNLAAANAVGTSILNVANGGTGLATLTGNGIPYGLGTSALGVTASSASSILTTNSSGVPSLSTTLPAFTLGDSVAGNGQTITGNITLTNATATTFFSTTASTTNLYGTSLNGFGLTTCSGTSFLQWSGGVFGCAVPAGGTGASSTLLVDTNKFSGLNTFTQPVDIQSAWIKTNGATLAYASSTNFTTVFGIGAGGNNATTSSSVLNGGNTAIGSMAMSADGNSGDTDTAVGQNAMRLNTSGDDNTGIGAYALWNNLTGRGLTAIGMASLQFNTGNYNTGLGFNSLNTNTSGVNNTALGTQTLLANNTGSNNVAVGMDALHVNSSGANNVALGWQTGYNVTGYGNILLGTNSNQSTGGPTTGSGNIEIGNDIFTASTTLNNQLNIGNLIFGTLPATSTAFKLPTSGTIGIGTTSPTSKFGIAINAGDTLTTLFQISSSTSNSTTTLFSIDNTGSSTAANGFNITKGCYALNGVCQSNASGFSTTSANFWSSVGLAHSTTSVAYQLTQPVILGNATSTTESSTFAQFGTLTVGTTTGYTVPTLSGTVADFVGANGGPLRIQLDTFNSNSTFGSQITGRRSGGTAAAPTAVLADYGLVALAAMGYGTTGYSAAGRATIQAAASGVWTDTSQGTYWHFNTSATTTAVSLERMRLDSQGALGIGTTSPYAKLSLHANPTDATIFTTLFAIGSSTPTATSTLFSIDNTGLASTTKFAGGGLYDCNGTTKKVTYQASSNTFLCETDQASGGVAWGAITGTLANQADLNAALYGKIGTTSALSSGQVVYATGLNTVASVATSTLTPSSPLTGSFVQIGSSGSLGCQTASGSQAGCESAVNFTLFNNKVATGSAETKGNLAFWLTTAAGQPTLGSVATGTITGSGGVTATANQFIVGSGLTIGCTAGSGSATGCIQSSDWTTFNMKVATSMAETRGQLAYWATTNGSPATLASVATSSGSCTGNVSCTAFAVIGSGAPSINTINNPTFSTSVTSPIIFGGSAAGSTLEFRSTSGAGIGAEFTKFTGGNNGATEFARMSLVGMGIGTTTPLVPLTIATSTKSQLMLSDGTTGSPWNFRAIGNFLYIATSSATSAIGATTSVPALSIDSSAAASLFVGTTTNNAASIAFVGRGFWTGLTASAANQTGDLCISATGEIINDSVTCIASSRRFKQDIKGLDAGLNELLQLRPVSFFYRPEYNGGLQSNVNYSGEQVGFIAEEVQAIDPRLSVVEDDGKTAHGVRYQQMTALIVRAIQDQQKQIDNITGKAAKSIQDKYQWVLIGILFGLACVQHLQIRKIQKQL